MNDKKLIKKSRYLSRILRHSPQTIGLSLEDDGWISIKQFLAAQEINLTRQELDFIVENDNKGRYQFNSSKTKIRAVQGHSVDIEMNFEEVIPPQTLYHGTKQQSISYILQQGLLPMKRQYVHCSFDKQSAVQVAERRKGLSAIISIKALEHSNQGGQWFQTANGIWLTTSVPAQFISSHIEWV